VASKKTVADRLQDTFENMIGPTQRGAITLERAYTAIKKNKVAPAALAEQFNANSANGHRYTADGLRQMANAYEDCKTRALVTKKQAKALSDAASGDSDLAPVPA
jgi:hypothetical protein